MLASCVVTWYQDSIAGAWKFLIAVGAGTGSVFILRWFWWRINAWSEVSAMAASFVVSLVLQLGLGLRSEDPREFAWIVLVTVAVSTAAWLAATWLTPPEPEETLLAFYRRVRPSAALWGPIAARATDVVPARDGLLNLMDWAAGCVLVYASLFGVGKILFGETALGLGMLAVAAAAGVAHLPGPRPAGLEDGRRVTPPRPAWDTGSFSRRRGDGARAQGSSGGGSAVLPPTRCGSPPRRRPWRRRPARR